MSNKIEVTSKGEAFFHCPGCNGSHMIMVDGSRGWQWNKSLEKPTFTPSVLVSGSEFTPKGEADYQAWADAGYPKNKDGSLHEFESAPKVCHSFVTDGKIQFLGDSTHELAGQTVDLPDWSE